MSASCSDNGVTCIQRLQMHAKPHSHLTVEGCILIWLEMLPDVQMMKTQPCALKTVCMHVHYLQHAHVDSTYRICMCLLLIYLCRAKL